MPVASPLSPRAVLRWHLDAGVDETIGETPVDRFQRRLPDRPSPAPIPASTVAVQAPASRPSEPRLPEPRPAAPATPSRESAVQNAVHVAAEATTIAALRDAVADFDECPLKKTATNLVFGDGNAEAPLVLIGEAPGAEEDRHGIPFVGPSGRLLDRMLASIGLDRDQVFISNTVFWRPPGNRSPTTSEVATCMPFVERMLELIAPKVLVAAGGPAATALLGQTAGVGKLRGRWFTVQTPNLTRPIPATAIFHPAYLLRSPAQKRLAWRDLLAIKARLEDR